MELSITRIGLLMKKQLIENKKLYLFGVLAMMGIMSFVFIMSTSGNNGFRINEQGVFFGVGIISFGCLFALTLFSNLDSAKGRTQQFTLPATTLEKLACAIIYGAILFPILYLISIYPILRLTNYVDNNYMGSINEAYTFNTKDETLIPLTIFFILQALVLLLSVFFRQYKVVKSIVLICVLFFGSMIFYPKIISQFLPSSFQKEIEVKTKIFGNKPNPIKTPLIKLNEPIRTLRTSNPFGEATYFSYRFQISLNVPFEQKIWFYIFLYASIPFMWLITWFRLKESEVN